MIATTADSVGARGADVELAALATILKQGPVSRTALARHLSLSQSTMTRVVKPLIDRGFVEETAEVLDGPGRPSRPLVGAGSGRRYVGIKLTGDEAVVVVTDMLAHEVSRATASLDSHGPADVADAAADLVRSLIDPNELTMIGVALGGSAIDGRTVDRAPFLGWRATPLAELLEQRLAVPVVVDNDVTALTAGEHWFGLGRGLDDFAVVTIGAGVGLGLVRHGEVLRTRDSGLGPAGHLPLDGHGAPCALGHRGCATAVLSIPSIEAQAGIALQTSISFTQVLERARDADRACSEIVADAASGLGRLLGLVANIAMVDTIVVAGDGIGLLDVGEAQVRARLRADRDPEVHDIDIRVDHAGFTRWARGAATVAIQSSLRRLLTPSS